MLDILPTEFRPFLGVGFLLVLFLAAASLIQRYQAMQAQKALRLQRLLDGAREIERALGRLDGQTLPAEVLHLFNRELVARYRGVKALVPKYQGIEELIRRAESRKEPGAVRGKRQDPPHFSGRTQLDQYTAGLTDLVDFLHHHTPVAELERNETRDMRERLRTLRAETRFAFQSAEVWRLAGEGEWEPARKEVLLLLGFLKHKAPVNDRGKALYRQASQMYQQVVRKQLPEAEGLEPEEAPPAQQRRAS